MCQGVPSVGFGLGRATRGVVVLAMVALSASVVTWAPAALACTTAAPPPGLAGYPVSGATGVPTDVVPVYATFRLGYPELGGPNPFRLRDADGVEVPLVMSAPYTWYVALTPRTALEPNTTYTIEASVPVPSGTPELVTASFTTGEGPAASPDPVDGAFLEHFTSDRPVTSCDAYSQGTCVALPSQSFVTARFVDEFGQVHPPELYRGPTFTNLSGVDQGTNFRCVRLSNRAPNGVESAPVELCGEGAAFYEYDGSSNAVACTDAGLTFKGETPEEAPGVSRRGEGGCSVGQGPARSGSTWLALVGLAALATARRLLPRRLSSSRRAASI